MQEKHENFEWLPDERELGALSELDIVRLKRLSKKGDSGASKWLGSVYWYGCGRKSNARNAFTYFLRGADQGDRACTYVVGQMLEEGDGIKMDQSLAFEYFTKAAAYGDTNAMIRVGLYLEEGKWTHKDRKTAYDWFCKAARLGNNQGKLIVAKRLLAEMKPQAKLKEALSLLIDAGRTEPEAIYVLGVLYHRGELVEADLEKAVSCYRNAAERGFAVAQFWLARMLEDGNGCDPNETRAIEWYKKSASIGYFEADLELGYRFLNGEGVDKDYARALSHFRNAARAGECVAMANIALLYLEGLGVRKSYLQAFKWATKSAQFDHAKGHYYLYLIHATARGKLKDKQLADFHLRKAATLGDDDAKEEIRKRKME
jgi:TPR repeat protein